MERGQDVALGVDDDAGAEILGVGRARVLRLDDNEPGPDGAYTWAATGGWDCSCEIAALTFWLTMPLTSLAPTPDRRDTKRLARKRATMATTTPARSTRLGRQKRLDAGGGVVGAGGGESSAGAMGESSSIGRPPYLIPHTVLPGFLL